VLSARRSRTIAAPVEELWEVIRDPHHLPRWWPRVQRVEDVEADAFTEVMTTAKGKVVRADFHVVEVQDSTRSLRWEQAVQGTPFARVLKAAETEISLTAAGEEASAPTGALAAQGAGGPATCVTIELRQTLNGFYPRFGGYMVRRAAAATIDGALDGLERISG
jgi:uncharacterized protein YndB with AHSA1/START domain